MLHMLILDVAKPFICCMQHVTHVAMGILLLRNRPMLVLDVECPGAKKSLKSYEGLAVAPTCIHGYSIEYPNFLAKKFIGIVYNICM